MSNRVSACVTAVVVAGLSWAAPSAAPQTPGAQSSPQAAKPFTPSRTPDGQPDLQGRYMPNGIGTQPGTGTTGKRERLSDGGRKGADLDSNFYRTDVFFEPSIVSNLPTGVISPRDGLVPLTPWARARKLEIQTHGLNPTVANMFDVLGGDTLCLPGSPYPFASATTYNGFQFVQGPGYVLLIAEFNHMYRFIPLDGRPHLGQDIRLWMGDSRGRWEGNTLVVDSTNFNGKMFLDGNDTGTVSSDQLHVVERYTIVDANTIAYQATYEDPKAFTQPWTLTGSYHRVQDKTWELYEYACHEGNVRHIKMMLER